MLGENIAQHRLRRNLTQAELAKESGVSKRTLIRLEQGESTQVTNLIRVLRALRLLGNFDALVPPPPPSPLEQLNSQRRRKRATSTGVGQEKSETWAWGDEDDDDHHAENDPGHDVDDQQEQQK